MRAFLSSALFCVLILALLPISPVKGSFDGTFSFKGMFYTYNGQQSPTVNPNGDDPIFGDEDEDDDSDYVPNLDSGYVPGSDKKDDDTTKGEDVYKRQAGVKAFSGPLISDRCKPELKDSTPATPGVLSKAGVKTAIVTDHPVIPIQYLPLCAGLAVREGMTHDDALRAITINPAEMCGIADRVGSLEVGKDACLLYTSRCV